MNTPLDELIQNAVQEISRVTNAAIETACEQALLTGHAGVTVEHYGPIIRAYPDWTVPYGTIHHKDLT